MSDPSPSTIENKLDTHVSQSELTVGVREPDRAVNTADNHVVGRRQRILAEASRGLKDRTCASGEVGARDNASPCNHKQSVKLLVNF